MALYRDRSCQKQIKSVAVDKEVGQSREALGSRPMEPQNGAAKCHQPAGL